VTPVAFVINPTLLRDPAGFGRRCRTAAGRLGWEPWLAETSESEDGFGLARDAVAAGARLVFAAGGDGTVRACAQALASTGVPLAIVPLGTANLTARALGLPGRADRAIDAGFGGRDHRIDLAVVDRIRTDQSRADGAEADTQRAGCRPGADTERAGCRPGADTQRAGCRPGADTEQAGCGTGADTERAGYLAMAGIGLDAAVVAGAGQRSKRRLGWVAYAVAGVARLSLPAYDFTVRLDGGQALVRRARCVVVGNAGLLPGGFVLLPGARLDDGVLDVGILAPRGAAGWARVAGLVMSRSLHQGSELERFQGRHVEISVGAELPRQVDGEVTTPGRTLNVSVRPGAVIVRLPR
jgi:diacylglycerol kinase family enzyme